MAESKRMVCKLAAIGPDELRGVAAMAVGVYQWEGKGCKSHQLAELVSLVPGRSHESVKGRH